VYARRYRQSHLVASSILSDSFRLQRITSYRNSFLPRICGRIIATASGSIVDGTMSLHPMVLAFMSFSFAALLLIGVGS